MCDDFDIQIFGVQSINSRITNDGNVKNNDATILTSVLSASASNNASGNVSGNVTHTSVLPSHYQAVTEHHKKMKHMKHLK